MLFAFHGRGVRCFRLGNFLQALPRHPHPRQTFWITTAQKLDNPSRTRQRRPTVA